ncbi:MAG TPA: hypothetical protein VFD59_10170 [Nocardioidaceae bacterium]|nr:hypothetical protein [Nocardioidaceae bacterium]
MEIPNAAPSSAGANSATSGVAGARERDELLHPGDPEPVRVTVEDRMQVGPVRGHRQQLGLGAIGGGALVHSERDRCGGVQVSNLINMFEHVDESI